MSALARPREPGSDDSSLGEWLRCLGSWLAVPLQCHALRLVWVPQVLERPQWVDTLEALDASTIDSGNGGEAGEGGWLLPLDAGESGVLCLFCASHASDPERAGAAASGVLERAALAASASWALARPCAREDQEIALVDKGGVRQAIHDFRNGLNSLLMNAATLTYRADTLPEPLRRFATQLQRDGERCSNALDDLEQLVHNPRPPLPPPLPGRPRQRTT